MIPLEQCRLVRYDEYSETLDQSFEYKEQVTNDLTKQRKPVTQVQLITVVVVIVVVVVVTINTLVLLAILAVISVIHLVVGKGTEVCPHSQLK